MVISKVERGRCSNEFFCKRKINVDESKKSWGPANDCFFFFYLTSSKSCPLNLVLGCFFWNWSALYALWGLERCKLADLPAIDLFYVFNSKNLLYTSLLILISEEIFYKSLIEIWDLIAADFLANLENVMNQIGLPALSM